MSGVVGLPDGRVSTIWLILNLAGPYDALRLGQASTERQKRELGYPFAFARDRVRLRVRTARCSDEQSSCVLEAHARSSNERQAVCNRDVKPGAAVMITGALSTEGAFVERVASVTRSGCSVVGQQRKMCVRIGLALQV